jgi:DNA-directed RNA polymerase subunit K/omega
MSIAPYVTHRRPPGLGAFEFVVLSMLRAGQLMRGCTPKIDGPSHKHTIIAQSEVAAGLIVDVRSIVR